MVVVIEKKGKKSIRRCFAKEEWEVDESTALREKGIKREKGKYK